MILSAGAGGMDVYVLFTVGLRRSINYVDEYSQKNVPPYSACSCTCTLAYRKVKQMRGIAIILGILASVMGVLSAISALSAVGADPAYSARLWAGWASLVLAFLAAVAALGITIRPRAASFTMLLSGIIGFVCINLFYINTFYIIAIQLWFLSTILAYISVATSASKKLRDAS
jgi:hypothetical protein